MLSFSGRGVGEYEMYENAVYMDIFKWFFNNFS
jgi:hypothetical protein